VGVAYHSYTILRSTGQFLVQVLKYKIQNAQLPGPDSQLVKETVVELLATNDEPLSHRLVSKARQKLELRTRNLDKNVDYDE
jgi:hypothetical protein